MNFLLGYDVNVDEINREVEDHPRIRPARHDRTRRPSAGSADRHHRMVDMCAGLVEQHGRRDDEGRLVGGDVANDDFDRLAFELGLMDDPERHEPGSPPWRSERKALSTARNHLRGRINGRARVYETPFQLVVGEHGKSLRINPIEQFALESPKRNLNKVFNTLVGSYQELGDLKSRIDLGNNPKVARSLELTHRSVETLAVMAHITHMQLVREIRALTGNLVENKDADQKLLL